MLAGDGDVGGLLGIHLREEMKLDNPIVSIDGLELKEFDYIDIGTMLEASGAVPVVIKSLIFPASAGSARTGRRADSRDRRCRRRNLAAYSSAALLHCTMNRRFAAKAGNGSGGRNRN